MRSRQTSTRRDALGIAALTVSMVVIGDESGLASPARPDQGDKAQLRPTREEMMRAARLYAGEFGGGMGAR